MVSQCHGMAVRTTHRNMSRPEVEVLSLGEHELEKLKVPRRVWVYALISPD